MYALFAGLMYYPEGGWGDHRKTSEDLESVRVTAKMLQGSDDWWHIIDLSTGRVIDRWATDNYDKSGPLPYARSAV